VARSKLIDLMDCSYKVDIICVWRTECERQSEIGRSTAPNECIGSEIAER